MRIHLKFLTAALPLLLCSCIGMGIMRDSTSPIDVKPNKATIIFMRPSNLGGMDTAPIYDVTDKEPIFVGSLVQNQKVAYQVSPGEHYFLATGTGNSMVWRLMRANVDASKTYYVLVSPVHAVFLTYFNLNPIRHDALTKDTFRSWDSQTTLMEVKPADGESYLLTRPSWINVVKKGKEKRWSKWLNFSDAEKREQTLNPEDGI